MSLTLVGLRIVAVFLVFFIHYVRLFEVSLADLNVPPGHLILNGYFGFSLLLILSGFFFGQSYLLKYNSQFDSYHSLSFGFIGIIARRYLRLLFPIAACVAVLLPLYISQNDYTILAFPFFFLPFHHSLFHPLGVTWTLPYDFFGIIIIYILTLPSIVLCLPLWIRTSCRILSFFILILAIYFIPLSLSMMFPLGYLLASVSVFRPISTSFLKSSHSIFNLLVWLIFFPMVFYSFNQLSYANELSSLSISLQVCILFIFFPRLIVRKSPRVKFFSESLFIVILLHYPILQLLKPYVYSIYDSNPSWSFSLLLFIIITFVSLFVNKLSELFVRLSYLLTKRLFC